MLPLREKTVLLAFKQFINSILARLLADIACDSLSCMVLPGKHPPLLARRRAEMIISRVRLVAAMFAVLTPLWIIVDVWVFEAKVAVLLGIGRILTSVGFAALAVAYSNSQKMSDAYRALAVMFGIPTLFFIYSHPLLSHYHLTGAAAAIAAGYAFLPFVMVAGLSVFPLTALEGFLYALPVLCAEAGVALMQLDMLTWSSHLGAFWLLMLITATATLSGMSQLAFMAALVSQATHDPLTQCFSRASGEEMLNIQFRIANRNGSSLGVVFVDLDNFKKINDGFGHDSGDKVLIGATQSMRETLRGGDVLIRWGGEEFLILLPNSNCQAAATMVERLRARGLGLRPDGAQQTASFGVATNVADCAKDGAHLVELADQRMYRAKAEGKDRCVGCEDLL